MVKLKVWVDGLVEGLGTWVAKVARRGTRVNFTVTARQAGKQTDRQTNRLTD